MKAEISLAEVRKILKQYEHSEIPMQFSIAFYTANREERTGGELISLDNCLLSRNQNGKKQSKTYQPIVRDVKRDPNNHKNQTINIIHKPSGNFFKVHFHLIDKFNKQKVLPNIYE